MSETLYFASQLDRVVRQQKPFVRDALMPLCHANGGNAVLENDVKAKLDDLYDGLTAFRAASPEGALAAGIAILATTTTTGLNRRAVIARSGFDNYEWAVFQSDGTTIRGSWVLVTTKQPVSVLNVLLTASNDQLKVRQAGSGTVVATKASP